jgi:hypothetical protein
MADRIPWGMTLRELLEALRAIDEKSLDMEVVACHPSGGYSPISHTSVLYVGLPVIHLAESKATEAVPALWSGTGDQVAAAGLDDLRKVWRLFRDFQAHNPGTQGGTIDSRTYKDVCSPGADVEAVWYRTSVLGVLQMLPESPLTPWTHEGDDALFQVAATFPMKKMDVGVVYNGLPFDLQVFLAEIGNASGQK